MKQKILRSLSLVPGVILITLLWRRYSVTISELAEQRELGAGSHMLGALVIFISGYALWKNEKGNQSLTFYVSYTAGHIIAISGGAFILTNAGVKLPMP